MEGFDILRDLVTTLNVEPVSRSADVEEPILDASTLNGNYFISWTVSHDCGPLINF